MVYLASRGRNGRWKVTRRRSYRRKYRGRRGGFSGDRYPQTLTLNAIMSQTAGATAPNNTRVYSTEIPIPRIHVGRGATSIEVKKVKFWVTGLDGSAIVPNDFIQTITLATRNNSNLSFGDRVRDGSTIADWSRVMVTDAGGTATQVDQWGENSKEICLSTDGYGTLVASDKLYLISQMISNTPVGNINVYCKVYYRFARTSYSDYVGIVQQQQN